MESARSEDTEAPSQPRSTDPSVAEDEEDEEADDGETAGGDADMEQQPATATVPQSLQVSIIAASDLNTFLTDLGKGSNTDIREVGREALCWQLSSAKPGNGVEPLRDDNMETYWQSDGLVQPHWIQAHFARRVAISHVALYLDYGLDESYTPKRLSISAGMSAQDLLPAVFPATTEIELHEPQGWCVIPLSSPPDPLDVYDEEDDDEQHIPAYRKMVRAHVFRIAIPCMHQNGRDTHVRQIKLFGPRMANGPQNMPLATGAPVALSLAESQEHDGMDHDNDDEDDDDWVLPAHMNAMTMIR